MALAKTILAGDTTGETQPAAPGNTDVPPIRRSVPRPATPGRDPRPELPPQGEETRAPRLDTTFSIRDQSYWDTTNTGEHGVISSRRTGSVGMESADIFVKPAILRNPPESASSDLIERR